MDQSSRQFFENRFGADFGNVRIHSGHRASGLTGSINARAVTYGNHIAFNQGEYQPGTTQGKKLIAHELTHVVQQGKAGQRSVDRAPKENDAKTRVRDEFESISVSEYNNNVEIQAEVFELAKEWKEEQNGFMEFLLGLLGSEAKYVALLKRDNLDEFTAGLKEKFKRKKYDLISEMDDMSRGRINTQSWEDVIKIVEVLDNQYKYEVKEIKDPKREIKGTQDQFGYPRFHVILQDKVTGITHEWQIGTDAVTKVYENRGIKIPKGLKLKKGMHRDLHDIEYVIFQPIHEKHKELAESLKIPEFRNKVDALSGKAGKDGDAIPSKTLKEEIAKLHLEASEILQNLYYAKGAEFITSFYH